MNIDISQLTAAELDELIAAAGERRSALQPPVSQERPNGKLEAIMNPPWAVSVQPTGSLLQILHRSYGWLAFVIPPAQRAALLSQLLQQAIQQTQHVTAVVPAAAPAAAPEAVVPSPSTEGGGRVH